jgi:hypothetical protein
MRVEYSVEEYLYENLQKEQEQDVAPGESSIYRERRPHLDTFY